jgi:hypothetical protein
MCETILTNDGVFVIEGSKSRGPSFSRTARENGLVRVLTVRRPRGKKLGLMHEFEIRGRTTYGKPIYI